MACRISDVAALRAFSSASARRAASNVHGLPPWLHLLLPLTRALPAVRGQPATVVDEAKPSTQASPLLYDLTTLQREANSRFGFSAKTTLSIAQALYEKHKVLTYPRTDSRHLPEDYIGTVKETLAAMASTPYAGFAGAELVERCVAIGAGHAAVNEFDGGLYDACKNIAALHG